VTAFRSGRPGCLQERTLVLGMTTNSSADSSHRSICSGASVSRPMRDVVAHSAVGRSMRRLRVAAAMVLLPLAAVAGCGSDDVAPTPATLNGTWIDPNWNRVVGSGYEWNLTATGTSITGTGGWWGEALGGGAITITGNIANGDVHLDLIVTSNPRFPPLTTHERFDGSLTAPGVLQDVTTSDNGTSEPTRMTRQ
jgi:hypothetical protein